MIIKYSQKKIIKIVLIVFAFTFLVLIFMKFFIPTILNMVQGLIALVMLWKISDNETIRFFGGLAFLFIGWKVYEVLIGFWIKGMNVTINEFTDLIKLSLKKKSKRMKK